MAMRPPLPSIRVSKKARIALWTVAIIIILVVALIQLSGVYINFMWFGEVGFRGVYPTIVLDPRSLFVIFGGLMAADHRGQRRPRLFLSPPFRPISPSSRTSSVTGSRLEPRSSIVLVIAALVSLPHRRDVGARGLGDLAAVAHGGSFGADDPQFHRDLSFFAWDYPVYRILLGFGFTAIIFSRALRRGALPVRRDPTADAGAQAHDRPRAGTSRSWSSSSSCSRPSRTGWTATGWCSPIAAR